MIFAVPVGLEEFRALGILVFFILLVGHTFSNSYLHCTELVVYEEV